MPRRRQALLRAVKEMPCHCRQALAGDLARGRGRSHQELRRVLLSQVEERLDDGQIEMHVEGARSLPRSLRGDGDGLSSLGRIAHALSLSCALHLRCLSKAGGLARLLLLLSLPGLSYCSCFLPSRCLLVLVPPCSLVPTRGRVF
eukprot:751313-Hanusia_phi.AAC.3